MAEMGGGQTSAEDQMTPAGVLESVLYAEDLDAAADFYSRVLGLTLYSRQKGRHVFFKCGDGMLLVFDPRETVKSGGKFPVPAHGVRGEGHLCFRASGAEIDHWRSHLQSAGVAIEAEVTWPGGGRSIYFRDPAGNSLEFAEPKIWGLS